MLNRSRWQKLKQMSPGAQFWEKRYILWRFGSYHQNTVIEDLKLVEWAIRKHKEQDRAELAQGEKS